MSRIIKIYFGLILASLIIFAWHCGGDDENETRPTGGTNTTGSNGSTTTATTSTTIEFTQGWNAFSMPTMLAPALAGTAYPLFKWQLNDVKMFSTMEGFAVGQSEPYSGAAAPAQMGIILHWDGSEWAPPTGWWDGIITPVTNLAWHLYSVDGASSNKVWAVVKKDTTGLILGYDGSTWTEYNVSTIQTDIETVAGTALSSWQLNDVAVYSDSEAVAVGVYYATDPSLLTLHYDGMDWGVMETITGTEYTNYGYEGVAYLDSTTAFGVGHQGGHDDWGFVRSIDTNAGSSTDISDTTGFASWYFRDLAFNTDQSYGIVVGSDDPNSTWSAAEYSSAGGSFSGISSKLPSQTGVTLNDVAFGGVDKALAVGNESSGHKIVLELDSSLNWSVMSGVPQIGNTNSALHSIKYCEPVGAYFMVGVVNQGYNGTYPIWEYSNEKGAIMYYKP